VQAPPPKQRVVSSTFAMLELNIMPFTNIKWRSRVSAPAMGPAAAGGAGADLREALGASGNGLLEPSLDARVTDVDVCANTGAALTHKQVINSRCMQLSFIFRSNESRFGQSFRR
jgi:hypothetical protein